MRTSGYAMMRVIALVVLFTSATNAEEDGKPKELDPFSPLPDGEMHGEVPDWTFGSPASPPFSLKVHFALGTTARACADCLSRAAVAQDIGNALYSAAHFDNCAFEEGLAYIKDRQDAAARDLDAAQKRFSATGRVDPAIKLGVSTGLFRLGQALHAVQDFYSHSNYIELMEVAHADFMEVDALRFFDKSGHDAVRRLIAQRGLVSGVWKIGVPKRCAGGALTHGELSKDTEDSGKGARVTRWGNSYYFAAVTLARRSTADFLTGAASLWPVVSEVCGDLLGMNQPRDLRETKGN
jgi:hypothetical protein